MGKKDLRASSQSPPSVSLTRKPHHELFIVYTSSPSLTLTRAHAARVCRSMTKKLESKIDSKGKANINNRTVVGGQLCVREHKRGADMVKGCEIQHLCNRPLAKIIQAWSEINVRAWKTWRNSMVSCGAVWQNRTYKKGVRSTKGLYVWGMLN